MEEMVIVIAAAKDASIIPIADRVGEGMAYAILPGSRVARDVFNVIDRFIVIPIIRIVAMYNFIDGKKPCIDMPQTQANGIGSGVLPAITIGGIEFIKARRGIKL